MLFGDKRGGTRGARGVFSFILIITLFVGILEDFLTETKGYKAAVSLINDATVIIIDAGHGGEDPGAVSVDGIYEKDLNLSISEILGNMLSNHGFAVVYTRTDDRLLYTEAENIKGIRKISDLKNRCKIGAEYPSAIYISVHMNSFKDPKYSGLQVYYGINNSSSQRLASHIQARVRNDLQPDNNRKIKPGKGLYLMENLDNVSVLIECGFMTNGEELSKLCEKEYQKALCFSIICGILEYKENSNFL